MSDDVMSAAELDRLEALAKAPGDDTWSIVPYGDGDSLVIHSGDDWRVCFMATPGDSPGGMARIEANAAHIAAFDPPTVLRLLAQARRAASGSLPGGMTDERTEAVLAGAVAAGIDMTDAATEFVLGLAAGAPPPPAAEPGLEVEALARIIAQSYGVDPDEDAPLTTVCSPTNRPLPWWHAYAEQALAIVEAGWSPAPQPGGAEAKELREDAERFRALMRTPRIKMQGSAGVDPHTGQLRQPDRPGSVHFGAEFWPTPARDPVTGEPKVYPDCTEEKTQWGRWALRALADDILACERAALDPPPGDAQEAK